MTDATGPQSDRASDDAERRQIQRRRPRERADAARNRARILAIAHPLFAEHGVQAVSMDQVAAAAGVGKGTLFRRFGDRAGLAAALLDEQERDLQEAILRGPPPLGPGADVSARLCAFLAAYQDYLDSSLDLIKMSETASPGARYRIGAYWFWHRHVTILLNDARPDLDTQYLAHALLFPLAAEAHGTLSELAGQQRARRGVYTLAQLILSGTVED
ncbi:MAG: TetR/AcrR family transcriptional regulator [Pseudonocardiaceae bacterium]